jgi:hypothetical protein
MWLLTGGVNFSLKSLSLREVRVSNSGLLLCLAYLFAWPGMNPTEYLSIRRTSNDPHGRNDWLKGARNIAVGAVIFCLAGHWTWFKDPIALGWAGMVGAVLVLHFGLFQLVSYAWRRLGVNARPLMDHPISSTSVAEFWGRGWNTAFRDVAHRFVFRPLAARIGATAGLIAGFVFSSLLHELVISVPAGGGYGGPTAYFCLQAAAVMLERSALGRAAGLGRGLRGWVFTAAVLLLPIRLLFHDPFVLRVVVPFMDALGAARVDE